MDEEWDVLRSASQQQGSHSIEGRLSASCLLPAKTRTKEGKGSWPARLHRLGAELRPSTHFNYRMGRTDEDSGWLLELKLVMLRTVGIVKWMTREAERRQNGMENGGI